MKNILPNIMPLTMFFAGCFITELLTGINIDLNNAAVMFLIYIYLVRGAR